MKIIKNGKIEDKKDEDLITYLEELRSDGYVFRGHSDQKWELIPSAFRIDNIKKAAKKFPIKERQIIKEWFYAPEVIETVEAAFFYKLKYPDILRLNPQIIDKYYNLLLHIMHYNYFFRKSLEDNKLLGHISGNDREELKTRSLDWWQEKRNFIWFVENTFYRWMMEIRGLDGKLIKPAKPDEKLINLDQELPQHYGIPTTALDWSYNPCVAIFFALDIYERYNTEFQLYVAETTPK